MRNLQSQIDELKPLVIRDAKPKQAKKPAKVEKNSITEKDMGLKKPSTS